MTSATRITLLISFLFAIVSLSEAATRMVAPVAPVAFRNAVADAYALASQHADAKVMKISGTSMLPFFGEGAVVVVKPISEAKLRAGMVVVYRNRFGETVAHRLVARQADAWIAKGYNNTAADSTLVSSANLIGVVYATFHTMGDAVTSSSVEVALAAPAR